MNATYAKLGRTHTYVWRDYDTTRQAAVAPYTVVFRWVDAAPASGGHGDLSGVANDPVFGAHALVSTVNPNATQQTFTQNSNIFTTLYPFGVTQGVAINGAQVGVMVEGVSPLIVHGRVDPGDLLVVASTTTAADLVVAFTTQSQLFQRVPHIRPLLHPYWGREVTLLATRVVSLQQLTRGTVTFNPNQRIYVIGVAETGTGAVSATDARIITARLACMTVY